MFKVTRNDGPLDRVENWYWVWDDQSGLDVALFANKEAARAYAGQLNQFGYHPK